VIHKFLKSNLNSLRSSRGNNSTVQSAASQAGVAAITCEEDKKSYHFSMNYIVKGRFLPCNL